VIDIVYLASEIDRAWAAGLFEVADAILAEALREIVVMPMKGKSPADIIARAENLYMRQWGEARAH
jgi:hypothetical protein